MRKAQLDFFSRSSVYGYGRAEYGGATDEGRDRRRGRRKVQRPFDRLKPVQLTMRATCAKGKLSMLQYKRRLEIHQLIEKEIKRAGAKLHNFANVGNHLHMLATFPSRAAFQKFLRTITAMIARLVTGARRGKPFGKFWDALAHSRVVTGLRAFRTAFNYIRANQVEAAEGKIAREEFLEEQRRRRRENS
jgi:REP element-mobilizing transposase RayT